MNTTPNTERKRLDSWKEIAEYVGRDVRTVMRWEQQGFPVRRVPGGQRRGVFAIPSEIDAWMAARGGDPPPDSMSGVQPQKDRRHRFAAVWILLLISAATAFAVYAFRVRSPVNREIVFRLGNNTYRFARFARIELKGQLGSNAVGDLNHDGFQDIVVGGSPADSAVVVLGRVGGFEKPIYLKGCNESSGPAIGDFDHDGNPDIAVTCVDTSRVQVWWGDGTGHFPSSTFLSVPGLEPLHCVRGDFNHDGIDDFVTDASGGGPITVFLSHGDRTFTPVPLAAGTSPQVPSVADLDGDGNLDLALACYGAGCLNVALLRGHGDGTFEKMQELPSTATVYSLVAADVTGDSVIDLFVASIDGQSSLYQGLGGGRFLPAKPAKKLSGVHQPYLLPQDGQNLVIDSQLYPAMFALLQFDPRGDLKYSSAVPVENTPRFGAVADFDRDGRDDLVLSFVSSGAGYLEIYLRR